MSRVASSSASDSAPAELPPSRQESLELRCPDGLPLRVLRHLPARCAQEAARASLPLVVICHGFKGFADWGFFPHLADALSGPGREVLRFDYSHNGVASHDPEVFSRLDLFERQSLTRHVADLGLLLDELAGSRPVWLVGHSMGGGVAVMRAADDARVAGLATLNGISHAQRMPPEALAQFAALGRVEIPNARTGQIMPLGRAWFDDVDAITLSDDARRVTQPALVLQGASDTTVLPEEGRRLAQWLGNARLCEIPEGDHTFGAKHPWLGWTKPLRRALAELQAFLPREERA
ncbi:MAG: hypothetical protein DHS20C15_09150 [Planctomycetota bacterium]|nr:MAG: hypothetical protein DHS20C15_09150 [Planctomycetota bacterium]